VGIALGPPAGSTLAQGNTVTGSGTVDLTEGNKGCGTNTWQDNLFVTDSINGVEVPS
jgi:hypothetical protein